MRGKLIFPMLAEIAQLRTDLVEEDPDGAGPLTSGYDEDFREPIVIVNSNDDPTIGSVHRIERCILIPAQIETREVEHLNQIASGASPQNTIDLVFHFKDLERLNLVDEDSGEAKLRNNDRLVSLRKKRRGGFIQEFRNPPGLFATEVQPRGFGFGDNRNLLLVTFRERALGR